MNNNSISRRGSFDSYGTQITVLSILLVLVYSNDCYDGWDALISLTVVVFSVSYLYQSIYFDRMSLFLECLLVSVAVIVSLESLWFLVNHYINNSVMALNPSDCGTKYRGIEPSLLISMLFTMLLYFHLKRKLA
jgi:hypothetical protein